MQLKNMGRNVDGMSEVLIPVLKKKLPFGLKRLWNKECYKYEQKRKRITITKFLNFLLEEIITMEDIPLEMERVQKKEARIAKEEHKGLSVSQKRKEPIEMIESKDAVKEEAGLSKAQSYTDLRLKQGI